MSILRQAAFGILRTVVRLAPVSSQRWAEAMLGELDHVEGDLSALRWALGGTVAIGRHSLIHAHRVRTRIVMAGAVLLLALLAMAGSRGMSRSQPANGGGSHAVTAKVP